MRNNEIFVKEINEERDGLRKEVRENILRILEENRKDFNKDRVVETIYEVGEFCRNQAHSIWYWYEVKAEVSWAL